LKYCVVIMDGAADWPLEQLGGKTCLEAARITNLNAMAKEGIIGLARTVPDGMEPSSAVACMSVLGYDPTVYYRGRASIEARSMGIPIGKNEVVFRCNLVSVKEGKMLDYSAGHISTGEAQQLIDSLNDTLGLGEVHFYPGVSYRHIFKIRDNEETLEAVCTPPHDIPGKPVKEYLPKGKGSRALLDLMKRSEAVLKEHPVNKARIERGEAPATTIWLFWGSGKVPQMPPFKEQYGVSAVMNSAVDLLRGLANMASMDIITIPGVTDAPDNDYAAQATALDALKDHDLVVIHVEAPDESGHAGSIEEKVKAIENIDKHIISRVRRMGKENIRLLVMPDHPTPIKIQTHAPEPVPFLLWGKGFSHNGATAFSEAEGAKVGLLIEPGYNIMCKLVK
jgi:2,3-bisphosphoglycerate-independent phosphoglycerate mutase